jgi:hypothetical protein
MAQWLKFWLSEGKVGGKRLIEPKTVREMLAMHCAIPVTWTGEGNVYAAKYYGWGLGWSVLDYRGRKIHTHTGGSGTFIAFMPQEQIGVVVLTNMEFTNLSGMLAYDVFDAYLLDAENRWSQKNWPQWLKSDEPPQVTGDKARQKLEQTRKTGTKPPTGLKNLAGKYRSDLYGEIELLFVNDDLSLRLGTNPPVAVKHWQDGSFISPCPIADSPWFDWLIHFRLNPAGIAESLDIDRIGWDEPMPRFQRVGNR